MKVAALFNPEDVLNSPDLNNMDVSGLSIDSRSIAPGNLFFAIKGAKFDSNQLLAEAIIKGAVAVVTDDRKRAEEFPDQAILVADARRSVSSTAHRFYGEPSSKLRCFGITGTNGKTSVAWALQHALAALGEKTAYIGTLGFNFNAGENIEQLENTSPEPILLHSILADALCAGCKNVVIEATSWGVEQFRTADVQWDNCVFTNLTRDHLDLHGDMGRYEQAKYRLFSDELATSSKVVKSAVLNSDDECGVRFLNRLGDKFPELHRYSFGWSERAQTRILGAEYELHRTTMRFGVRDDTELVLNSQLIGSYNVLNLAAAFTSLLAIGFDPRDTIRSLSGVPSVPGRMERIVHNGRCVVVDYAHTPDALEKLHIACREITDGRLISVFGAGGDRDKGKRPIMGSIAARLADHCVVTSDNPRTEDPEKIVADILPGMESAKVVDALVDRKQAIAHAIQLAKPGDIVIIAGKGHEDYQIIGTTKTPFSDREVALDALHSL